MFAASLIDEARFDPIKHVEKILGAIDDGDVTAACWEPGQTSPYHCHPEATEIYFCFEGGGMMRTPDRTVEVRPGGFGVHPRGEMHEYVNGPERTVLFRVRHGTDMAARTMAWPTNPDWSPTPDDSAYFERHPVG